MMKPWPNNAPLPPEWHAKLSSYVRSPKRLRRQFPELPAQQIDATVHGNYDAFEGSRIRDFIPVLVERATRQELSGSTYRRA
jgi:hypothetical protein